MKHLIFLPMVAALYGCTPAKFAIDSRPPTASADRQSLDNLECSQQAAVGGPWLYGLGWLIYKRMSANSYERCMTARGYAVHEQ